MKKIAVILTVLCILLLTACRPAASNPAEARVEQFFQTLKNGDAGALTDFIENDEFDFFNGELAEEEVVQYQQSILKSMFGKVDVQIKSSTVQDDTATVECTVTAPDMYDAILSIAEDSMLVVMEVLEELGYDDLYSLDSLTEEKMDELTQKVMSKITALFETTFKNTQTKKTDVTISLYKSGDKWMIDYNEQLINAIVGGSYSELKDMDFFEMF